MPSLYLTILAVLLAAACASDLADRSVPNVLAALLAGTGLVAQGAAGGVWALVGALLAGLGVFAALFPPWLLGKLGGGDLKLAVGAAVWAGVDHSAAFLFLTLVAGVPLALATQAIHRISLYRAVRDAMRQGCTSVALAPAPATVPVAVAISLGLLAALRGVGMS